MANELHILAANPNTTIDEINSFIAKGGVDVNALHSEHGTSAVAFAAQTGNLSVLKLLIDEYKVNLGIELTVKPLLSWARENPDPAVFDYVFNPTNGVVEKFNLPELSVAVLRYDTEKIERLLSEKPELLRESMSLQQSPLFQAAERASHSIVHAIVDHSAFVSWDDVNKKNPMFFGYAAGAMVSGNISWKKSEWRQAGEFFNEAIRCYEKITSKSDLVLQELAVAYFNLGSSNGKMNHLEPAIQAFNKAESILASCTDINDKCDYLLSDCATQKGNLFGIMRRYDLERVEYEKALALSRKRGRSEDALREEQALAMLIEKSIGQEQMDVEAKKFGLMLKEDVPHDGDCFFSAALLLLNEVKPPILRKGVKPDDLRGDTVGYLKDHQSDFAAFVEGSFETYMADMDKEGTWADYPAFCAFAQCFKVTLFMLPSNGSTPTVIHCDAPRAVVTLGHVAGAHFQPLYRTSEEFAPLLQRIINEARPSPTEEASSDRAAKVRRTASVGGVGEGVRVIPPSSPSAKSNAFFPAPDATTPAVCTSLQTADALPRP